MDCERRRHSNFVLNLTPLIDIVFLLLVFFMLTAHFIEDESISIDLPEATSSDPARENAYVEVQVTPEGHLILEGKPTPIDNLEQALIAALGMPGKRFVRLKGDQEAHFGIAVKVIDAARNSGAEALDILTERP
jgi:biopolymer transport protein ExbD